MCIVEDERIDAVCLHVRISMPVILTMPVLGSHSIQNCLMEDFFTKHKCSVQLI